MGVAILLNDADIGCLTKKTLVVALLLSILVFIDIETIFDGNSDVVFFLSFFLGAATVHAKLFVKKTFHGAYSSILLLILLFSLALFYISYTNASHYKSILCTLCAYLAFLFFITNKSLVTKKYANGLQLLGR